MKSDKKILFLVFMLTLFNIAFFIISSSGSLKISQECEKHEFQKCECDKLKMVIEMDDQKVEDYTEHYNQYMDIDKLMAPASNLPLQACLLNYTSMSISFSQELSFSFLNNKSNFNFDNR